MATPFPVLDVSGVSYRYADRLALNDVDLRVMRGEVFALLGPNGAGKSTLIRTLCGRLKPSAGKVEIDGDNPAISRLARAKVGLVPQDIALYPYLTVAENLSVFGRLAGIRGAKLVERIRDAVVAAGLEERMDQRIEILSGGYKRRANIASALLHAPKLLVLDEPTVGVDLEARNSINAVLRSLAEAGMSVLITTHDLDQAASVASKVGIIFHGEIIKTGAPEALVAERFGNDRELILVLNEPAPPEVVAFFYQHNFKSLEEGRRWRGRLSVSDKDVGALTDQLAAAGAVVRETRIRQPGLDSLYADLTGESEVA
ncbi:MAG: ABC transporter ATP-binding protein [Candidatus Phaeomarinobacter sp.]